jgi:hypothetical protein
MAITHIKIHPAIGVARVGNSPDEFFIGPERPWERPDPPGGFKDGQCRVKWQATRFRLFAYNDDNTVQEITDPVAEISWTVHLVNKKAVTRNAGSAANLTIDPGPRVTTSPNQRLVFDNGQITLPGASTVSVPLGEIRTDDGNHLLVLGGFGKSDSPTNKPITEFYDNEGWYDDISDGPVTAHVTMRGTGEEFDAAGAWVIVGPPKFAPQIDNVITLYDRLFQIGVEQGWLAGPVQPSYTNDIHSILERARTTRWVEKVFGAHTWPDPVYDPGTRSVIFNRLANPSGGGGNMPQLNNATLTQAQYDVMTKWKDGNFTQDWIAPPVPPAQITPAGLDRAALENCVGAAFFPGIEAGGITAVPILDTSNYIGAADPLRLDHASVGAGDISEFMALPWQADFKACGENWWPVPRPNWVTVQATGTQEAWARDVGSMEEMVDEWHTLGFVVRQGNVFVEVDRCDTTFITLLTPSLNFQDVPQGPVGMSRKTALAVSFEVKSTGSAVTLEVQPGDLPTHPRLRLDSTSLTVAPTVGTTIATARFWVIYETGPVGEVLANQMIVRHLASGRSWTIPITANTVARKVAAAALVLDRSGSMAEDRGDGQSKYQSLRQAASIFVDVMLEGDGVGIVRYNEDAQPLRPITTLGDPGDPLDSTRQDTKDILNGPGLTPSGATSIGDGIFEGCQILNAAGPSYDVRALVVLTDGKENRERWIADVAADIDELTYSLGLGTPQNTSAPALQAISGNHGGYLLVTGPISGDNRFILQKYFLQILAGISNAEIVLDPSGYLISGQEHRIPFQMTEADAGMDVILLTPSPQVVEFRLQTPTGSILEPWRAIAEPRMSFVLSQGVSYYRLVLPAELVPARFDQAGTWHALLRMGRPRLERPQPMDPRRGQFIRPTERPLGRRIVPQSMRLAGTDPARGFGTTNPPAAVAAGSEVATQPPTEGRTLPYSLLVHTYSNLSFRASLEQSGWEPGAQVTIHGALAESGMSPRPGTSVWAEITESNETSMTIRLAETDVGRFSGSFTASVTGVYRCRVRASGRTRAGHTFQREQTLTAAVWQGGRHDADPKAPQGRGTHGD